jgi:hypothetical protein
MALLGDTLLLWLLIIAVEGGYRLFGKEADITGIGALVAGGLALIGAILNFDIGLLLANGVLFVVWGAVIPPDDEFGTDVPESAPTTDASGGTTTNTTADTARSGNESTVTASGRGEDTNVFDGGSDESADGVTRVYDPEDP